MGLGVIRFDPDRLAERSDRRLLIASQEQGNAEVVMSIGQGRIETNRRVKLGDCLLQLAIGLQGFAEIIVEKGDIRPEADCLPICSDRFVQIPPGGQSDSEVSDTRPNPVDPDRCTELNDRFIHPPLCEGRSRDSCGPEHHPA